MCKVRGIRFATMPASAQNAYQNKYSAQLQDIVSLNVGNLTSALGSILARLDGLEELKRTPADATEERVPTYPRLGGCEDAVKALKERMGALEAENAGLQARVQELEEGTATNFSGMAAALSEKDGAAPEKEEEDVKENTEASTDAEPSSALSAATAATPPQADGSDIYSDNTSPLAASATTSTTANPSASPRSSSVRPMSGNPMKQALLRATNVAVERIGTVEDKIAALEDAFRKQTAAQTTSATTADTRFNPRELEALTVALKALQDRQEGLQKGSHYAAEAIDDIRTSLKQLTFKVGALKEKEGESVSSGVASDASGGNGVTLEAVQQLKLRVRAAEQRMDLEKEANAVSLDEAARKIDALGVQVARSTAGCREEVARIDGELADHREALLRMPTHTPHDMDALNTASELLRIRVEAVAAQQEELQNSLMSLSDMSVTDGMKYGGV